MLVDTHAHLDDPKLLGRIEQVLDNARNAGVEHVISVGIDEATSETAIELAGRFDMVKATVGVHPHYASRVDDVVMKRLEELARQPNVVAIGETGLDYYRDRSPRDAQRRAFERQIELALALNLPVVVHCRDAWPDCLEVLDRWAPKGLRGAAHCFSGDAAIAARLRRMGFYISFAGNVTYPSATSLREAAARVSAEALLVETDCPYLAPTSRRGQDNEPAFVRETAEGLARVYSLTVADVERVTSFNAFHLFGAGGAADPGTIVYPIRDGLYVNLTNRCTNRCAFCARETRPMVKGHNLALETEPSPEMVTAAIGDPRMYKEIVFCGFGEPTLRLDALKAVAAWVKRLAPETKVRINTNGHGSLIHGRPICAELKGLVDSVSVSLNTADRASYARLCRPDHGPEAYDALLAFVREAKAALPEVVVTAIDMPGVDIAACQRKAAELGVALRVRKYDDVGTPK